MSTRILLLLGVLAAAVAALVVLQNRARGPGPAQLALASNSPPGDPLHQPDPARLPNRLPASPNGPGQPMPAPALAGASMPSMTKLERLASIRENFRLLAKGNPTAALHAARQLTDPTERETALLTLVTEWTNGELRSPVDRARAIAAFGLETGLGMELSRQPELAALWADELTEGQGKLALLASLGVNLVASNAPAAFALAERLPEKERREYSEALLSAWAEQDTEAALQWANQTADPNERDLALQSIRQVAPVGIGAAVSVQGGYPIIQDLMPGSPAALSGQLGKGDRILALAQQGSPPVDTHGLSLESVVNMIRGAPGTMLQVQVEPAGAAPGSQPRTVWITRDQLLFKK